MYFHFHLHTIEDYKDLTGSQIFLHAILETASRIKSYLLLDNGYIPPVINFKLHNELESLYIIRNRIYVYSILGSPINLFVLTSKVHQSDCLNMISSGT